MAKNSYITQFHSDLRARYPVDGADLSYSAWLELNTKLSGRRFGYAGYEFQRAIVDDMSPDLCVIKPSQVGMTEVQVRKFLAFLARNRGTSGIFSFPNEKMFKSNSKTRIKPVVSQPAFSSSMLEDEKPQRAMNLFEINGSFAHITGMTEGDATSTPADILFHDELDLSNQSMIGLFQSRLQNSDFKITQKFSTPTHPGFGIDASYNASCQYVYMAKCGACNHYQDPYFAMKFLCLPGYQGDGNLEDLDTDMVSLIDLKNSYFACERCSKRLDLGNAALREWVAMYPARQARGYRIRPTSTVRLGPDYIIRQLLKMKELDNLKGWKNTVLGETHSDGNSKLEPADVEAIMEAPGVPDIGWAPVALGCDMGITCHLTLGAIRGEHVHPFLFKQVKAEALPDEIAKLRQEYNIVTGGVDRHPYTPTANYIRELTKGIILPLEYKGLSRLNAVKDEYGNIDHIQINRTKAIDKVVREIRMRKMSLNGFGAMRQLVIEHLCDMVRVEADETPAIWQKLTGNDHFMHSLVLMLASVEVADFISFNSAAETRSLIGLVGVTPPKNSPVRNLHGFASSR